MSTVEYCDVCGREACDTGNPFVSRGIFTDTKPPFGAWLCWKLCGACTTFTRTQLEQRRREIGVVPPKRRLFGRR